MYLVVGGAGFIGSHIVDRLVGMGQEVRVLDDFSSGKIENLEQNLDRIEVMSGSVADPDAVRQAVQGADYVIHQAAIASVPLSIEDPITSNEVNITGTLNILVAARDEGVKRVVCASSAAVYGDNPVMPKVEEMMPEPMSPYALTKLADEHYCRMFTQLYGLETVCLRYFNVFGPRQDPASQYAGVIAKFLTAMLDGKQLVIFGDGLQSRDFVYVANVAEANLLACRQPGVAGEVFNIACGSRYSLLDLVDHLNHVLGMDTKPVMEPARAGDVKHSLADIGKAREMLGFSPEVEFPEGLEKLAAWFRDTAA